MAIPRPASDKMEMDLAMIAGIMMFHLLNVSREYDDEIGIEIIDQAKKQRRFLSVGRDGWGSSSSST